MRNRWNRLGGLLALAVLSAGAQGAVCTSLSAGDWNVAARWDCGGVNRIPLTTDSVVIAHNAIRMRGNYTVAGVTVNAGAVLNDNGNNLTVNGNVVINGQLGINQGGALRMRTAGATLSGTGSVKDIVIEIDAANITLAAGSTLDFDPNAEIDVGANMAGSLIIDGTVTAATQTLGDRVIRVSSGGALTVGAGGVVDAPNSRIDVRTGASLLNNGDITVSAVRGRTGAPAPIVTQGANANLTVSSPSCDAAAPCFFDASAAGNTVTFNGTATVIAPVSGYWNLAGTIFPAACPVAYTISGSSPCPAGGPLAVTMSPGSCVSTAGIGSYAWTPSPTANVNLSDNTYASSLLLLAGTSNYLVCTGYNFAIPAGATILGITVNVERKSSSTRTSDAAMRLVNAGLIGTVDRSTTTTYTTADVSEAHGGNADLWGAAWTPADINNPAFGAAFAAKATRSLRTVTVDHMPITVTYAVAAMDHVAINAPATAMTLAEVPVTIAPHSAAHGALPAAGTIDLSTSTGTGDWTIGTGTGTLTPGAPNSGLATYTFGSGESVVALGFTAQAPGTVTLNVASGGADMLLNTPVAEKANTIIFSGASFVFTDSACVHNVAFGAPGQTCAKVVWSPRVAGQALGNIYITSVNTAGVPTRLHPTQDRTRTMEFGMSCHDPIAHAGVQATFSATAELLPLCQGSGATPTIWTTGVVLTFPGGSPSVGPYSFNYADVGKVEMWVNRATTSERGSSGAFVVKPAGFTLSSITRSSDSAVNPGAANAAGAAFVKAGEAFTVTVTAVNAAGTATPNYGKEVVPESVKLTTALAAGLGLTSNPALTCSDATNATICDTTTTPGVNIPRFGAFSAGAATGVNFAWDEVGIITLTPHVADASYLAAGDVAGTTSGNVGRFSLGKFALQGVSFDDRADLCQGGLLVADGVTACAPPFTYLGEQIDANFTLVPKSLSGVSVQNYVDSAVAPNDFAKLDPTIFADLSLAAIDSTTAGGPHYLTGRISNTALPVASCATAPCFQSGSADVTVPFLLTRNAAPDGAYAAVNIGIAPVDADGARVEGAGAAPGLCNKPNAADCYDLDSDATAGNDRALLAATEFRHGRTLISNAYGSELLGLVLPLATEYWNGSTYVKNADDSETAIAIALGNYQRNLNAGETTATVSAIVNGVGRVTLTPPGANNNGSVDVSATAPAYLPGTSGRATFGVYKGPFIYMREQY